MSDSSCDSDFHELKDSFNKLDKSKKARKSQMVKRSELAEVVSLRNISRNNDSVTDIIAQQPEL
jgi:hypothetical protein